LFERDFDELRGKTPVDTLGSVAHPPLLMLRTALLLALLSACDNGTKTSEAASPPPVQPTKTTTFGAGVTLADTTPIDKILAEPTAFKGKTVRVEGMVVDVCPKRGCWFEMAGSQPGQKLKFKVTDGEMVFPLDSKGMVAVAQGQVAVTEMSIDESKKYAQYQAKEYGKPDNSDSITKPTQVVRIDGTGAVFRDKK
jgi:hypothetical protein